MSARYDKLRKIMEDTGVSAVISTSFHNTLYYSNFWMTPFGRGHFAVLPRDGYGTVVAPRIEFDRPTNTSWFDDVRIYWDTRSPLDGSIRLIRESLGDRGIHSGRIGIEQEYITLGLFESLKIALPDCEFVDVTLPIMEAQIVKSELCPAFVGR